MSMVLVQSARGSCVSESSGAAEPKGWLLRPNLLMALLRPLDGVGPCDGCEHCEKLSFILRLPLGRGPTAGWQCRSAAWFERAASHLRGPSGYRKLTVTTSASERRDLNRRRVCCAMRSNGRTRVRWLMASSIYRFD